MTLPEDIAIRVLDISKNYQIKHIEQIEAHGKQRARHRLSWLGRQREGIRQAVSHETFWALRNICFDVPSGQVLGIIGRNGAGKSTFLKILSQIIEPTQGSALIRGKVGSLLEVGTGFHPELTGRENIYLNGTLLGMRRRQISSVFDEIMAFAEVERFIDTPVKRYSSGMYVRLAFAVAAYLQPDVLIIDEVLSVGDAVFQEKCLGRMQSLGDAGRTVIFVSHNMEAVAALCDRAIVLHQGMVYFDGSPQEATDAYYSLCRQDNSSTQLEYRERGGSRPEIIQAVSSAYRPPENGSRDEHGILTITITGRIEPNDPLSNRRLHLAIGINQENGHRLGTYVANDDDDEGLRLHQGSFSYAFRVDDPPLHPGTYFVDISLLCREETVDSLQRCADFRIPHPTSNHYKNRDAAWGSVRFTCTGYNSTMSGPEDA
jgi:lipopolysaccharide transport system ATP-binding protein